MSLTIATIVEGHGEVQALPVLLRRFADALGYSIQVPMPIRVSRDRFLKKQEEFDRMIALAVAKSGESRRVLILVDADDDCAKELGARVSEQAQKLRPDVQFGVVCAVKEYECWFLAALDSLIGKRGIPQGALPPLDPESIRGAKEWLNQKSSQGYDPARDQAAYTQLMDIDQCRSARSFQKMEKEAIRLLSS